MFNLYSPGGRCPFCTTNQRYKFHYTGLGENRFILADLLEDIEDCLEAYKPKNGVCLQSIYTEKQAVFSGKKLSFLYTIREECMVFSYMRRGLC